MGVRNKEINSQSIICNESKHGLDWKPVSATTPSIGQNYLCKNKTFYSRPTASYKAKKLILMVRINGTIK